MDLISGDELMTKQGLELKLCDLQLSYSFDPVYTAV